MTAPDKAAAKLAGIVTVRPAHSVDTRQNLPNFVGVCAETAGARGIAMNMVIIPPGAAAAPHLHRDHETAIYILEGRVLTLFGEGLSESVVNEAGDFVYIPASLPHQPINVSETERAVAIVARTDPNEQESVELYPASAAGR